MMFTGAFKARYPILRGKDWVKTIDPEDLRVFVSIGAEANLHGVMGGRALAKKRGSAYMSELGKRGACVSNGKRTWRNSVKEENYKELGVILFT